MTMTTPGGRPRSINRYQERIAELEAELAEMQQLEDMRHDREVEVIQRWRAEGKVPPLTFPDYGNALDMALQELAAERALADRLAEALAELAVAPVSWDDELRAAVHTEEALRAYRAAREQKGG